MITTVFQEILDTLNEDGILTGYIGANHCYRARMTAPSIIPSVTIMENNEKCTPRVGYDAVHVRDHACTVQVDIWVSSSDETFPCTGEDTDLIAERIDELLLNSRSEVVGTRAGSWQKVSSSQQYEADEMIWHNALRYSFEYSKTDT